MPDNYKALVELWNENPLQLRRHGEAGGSADPGPISGPAREEGERSRRAMSKYIAVIP